MNIPFPTSLAPGAEGSQYWRKVRGIPVAFLISVPLIGHSSIQWPLELQLRHVYDAGGGPRGDRGPRLSNGLWPWFDISQPWRETRSEKKQPQPLLPFRNQIQIKSAFFWQKILRLRLFPLEISCSSRASLEKVHPKIDNQVYRTMPLALGIRSKSGRCLILLQTLKNWFCLSDQPCFYHFVIVFFWKNVAAVRLYFTKR